MTTTTTTPRTNVDGNYSSGTNRIDNDEISTWKRIAQYRVKESEALGLTARLLNDYGNEAVTGNIDTALEADDDMDALIVVRQFLLQQLLLHHIGVLMNSNTAADTDATHHVSTTHERITSWKRLRDIFRTIDEAKTSRQTMGNNNHVLPQSEAASTHAQHQETSETAIVSVDGRNTDDTAEIESNDDNGSVRRPLSEMVRAHKVNQSNQSATSKKGTKTTEPCSSSINGVNQKGSETNKITKTKQKQKKNDMELPTTCTKLKETTIPKKRKRPPAEPIVVQKPRPQQSTDTNGTLLDATTAVSKPKKGTDATKSKSTVPKKSSTEKSDTLAKKRDKLSSSKEPSSTSNSTKKSDTLAKKKDMVSSKEPSSSSTKKSIGKKTSVTLDSCSVVADVDRPIQKRVRPTLDGANQQTNLTSLIPVEQPPIVAPPIRKKTKNTQQLHPENSSEVPFSRKRKLTGMTTGSKKPPNSLAEDHSSQNGIYTNNDTIHHPDEAACEITTEKRPKIGQNREMSLPKKNQNNNANQVNVPTNTQNPSVSRLPLNGSEGHTYINLSTETLSNRNGSKHAPPYSFAQLAERSDSGAQSSTNATNQISNISATNRPSYNSNKNGPTSERIGQPDKVFDNEAVKESRQFLSCTFLNGDKRWACSLCDATGIRHLARHCEKDRHRNLLKISLRDNEHGNIQSPYHHEIFENEAVKLSLDADVLKFERIDGHKIWQCILCNTDGIRTIDVVDHCENPKHQGFMRNRPRDPVDSDLALTNGQRDGKILFNNDALSESREFLVRGDEDQFSKVKWSCKLCDVNNISTIHLVGHCETEQHKIYLKMKRKAALIAKRRAITDDRRSNVTFVIEPNATKVWYAIGESKSKNPATFLAKSDGRRFSCTHTPRLESCMVKVDATDIPLQDAASVGNRLQEWEPFWIIKSIVCIGLTAPVISVAPPADTIHTAMQHFLPGNLKSNYKFTNICKDSWDFGDSALLLRMLPKSWIAGKAKRADCHLWPKGTFLQINGAPCKIDQRVQQSVPFEHLWKHPCKELVCNELLGKLSDQNCIQICAADNEEFYYALSYCTYLTPEQIYSNLVDQTNIGRITNLSFEICEEKAKEVASKQLTELIDSDNDETNDVEETGKFVFSLTCPISRKVMVTPVRGKDCKHFQVCIFSCFVWRSFVYSCIPRLTFLSFQCFDLRNYIDTNIYISYNRWRCASCENFVSLQSLQICGLTSHLLKEFQGSATSERGRVEFSSDGRYKLLEQQVSRHKKRLESTSASANAEVPTKALAAQNIEIIDCD